MGIVSDDFTCVRMVEQWEIGGTSPAAVSMPNKCMLYVESAMQEIHDKWGPGAAFGIVVHELAHFLLHDINTPIWPAQLEADELAGCALARSKRYRFEDYIALLRDFTSMWPERVEAAKRGADRCG